MAFRQLQSAWSSARTLYRDAHYVLVDKPAGVACRGRGAARDPDLCQRLAHAGIPGLRPCLEVPERASGVTLLAFEGGQAVPSEPLRSEALPTDAPASEASASGALPFPLLRLDVVLGVEDWRLPAEGRLESRSAAASPGFDYRVIGRHAARALVRVQARVGPEQVARAFAQAGQPGVGMETPAPLATRELLHVERAQGAALDVSAPLPGEFESWLRGAPQRPAQQLSEALVDGSVVRSSLWSEHQVHRLIGEDAGEIAGVTVDRYGEYAVLELSTEEAWSERERLAECLLDYGAQGVYAKRRLRADLRKQDLRELAPPLPLRGSPAPEALRVQHGPLQFWVSLGDGLATGLFLDQRENWERVRRGVHGVSLLNLFSYTGAFSVAAAAGGASASVSVDLSKRALSRLRLNLELNGLSGPQHRLLASDALSWLGRAVRSGQRFHWIVLDPPSFGTRRGGVLRTERDYAELVASCLELLEPGGRLLCVSHQRGFSLHDLRELVSGRLAASGRSGSLECWVGGWDAATLPGVSRTKSVLARRA